MTLALLAGLGTGELIMIGIGLAIVFGAAKIPQIMRGVGQGIKEFKSAMKDEDVPASAPPAPPTGGPTVNPTTSDETPS